MSKNDTNGAEESAKKRQMPIGRRFTPMTSKQAQEAAVRARAIRKQVRAEMLDTLVNNMNFGEELIKAMKKGDTKKIEVIQTALRIVGLTHDQSEDAVSKLQVDANVDTKADVAAKIEFVLPKTDTETTGE